MFMHEFVHTHICWTKKVNSLVVISYFKYSKYIKNCHSSFSQNLPQKSVSAPRTTLIFPTPLPALLIPSFFPFPCHFISESLNYFVGSEAVSSKCCENIFPRARLVSNLVISTVYGKRFKQANIQEKNGKTSRYPTGTEDYRKGSETSIAYSSSHVFQWIWQLPCCFLRAVHLSWYVLHALSTPTGFNPPGESHAGNAILVIFVMLECEAAVCLSWAFDSWGSSISEVLSSHLMQKEKSRSLHCSTGYSPKHLTHLTSTSEYINPNTKKHLGKLNAETKNMDVMQLIPVWQKINDSMLGRQKEPEICVGDMLTPPGPQGRDWGWLKTVAGL